MKDLNTIGEELFDKIRGRFPSVTIGGKTARLLTNQQTLDSLILNIKNQADHLAT